MVAQRENTTLRYMHQDHLSGTSLMTDTGGNSLGTMKYYPYGSTRSGSIPTDELFTGQKLDGTGLYYYGARYYDPVIGRFISADTIIPNPADPQSFNRYSYCLNNPLKYIDPSGHDALANGINVEDIDSFVDDPSLYMMVAGFGTGQMAQNDTIQIYNIWCDVRKANPKLTAFIEDSNIKVYYQFANLGGDSEGFTYGVTAPHGSSLESLESIGTATDIDV